MFRKALAVLVIGVAAATSAAAHADWHGSRHDAPRYAPPSHWTPSAYHWVPRSHWNASPGYHGYAHPYYRNGWRHDGWRDDRHDNRWQNNNRWHNSWRNDHQGDHDGHDHRGWNNR